MKKRIVFASTLMLALAASTVSFSSIADAAIIRHHGGGHSMGHSSGGQVMRHFNGGHRYAFHRGHGHRWARGGGGYYGGYYDDYCDPVQLALGLCIPYFYAPYGPFGML